MVDTGRFPTQAEGLDALVHQPAGTPAWHRQMDDMPKDGWGWPFIYRFPGKKDPGSYDLISVGPDGKEGTPDDITQ
jgi:general secretion pathway protein G